MLCLKTHFGDDAGMADRSDVQTGILPHLLVYILLEFVDCRQTVAVAVCGSVQIAEGLRGVVRPWCVRSRL